MMVCAVRKPSGGSVRLPLGVCCCSRDGSHLARHGPVLSVAGHLNVRKKQRDVGTRFEMVSASSALIASIAVNPASSTISTARIRSTISSSTTSTLVSESMVPDDMKCPLSVEETKRSPAARCSLTTQRGCRDELETGTPRKVASFACSADPVASPFPLRPAVLVDAMKGAVGG